MKEKEILTLLKDKLHIDSLNAMQQALVGAVDTPAREFVLLSPTGSGKTVAFTIAMLKRLRPAGSGLQSVVIVPSRELALQVGGVVKTLANGYRVLTFYGGHPMVDEVASLAVTPDVIVSTPGRLLDHVNRRHVDPGDVSAAVLDEYDKSLELGFADEMRRLVKAFGKVSTLILTSATPIEAYPDYLNPKEAVVLDFKEQSIKEDVERPVRLRVMSWERDKLATLADLVNLIGDDGPALVFVNHRESAERVYNYLKKSRLPVGMYHGGLEQRERENALEMFRNGTTPLLVTTDLAARGLDIPTVGSVIHYHLPPTPETWTHRNGRTGRLGGVVGKIYVITAEDETIPAAVTWDREFHFGHNDTPRPFRRDVATLYFNVGRREKISRGDIVGYLVNKGGLTAGEIGRIDLRDHCALVAVPCDKARAVVAAVAPHKIKNTRAKVSINA